MTLEPTDEPTDAQPARAAARLTRALDVAVADAGLSLPLYRLLAFLSGGPERGRRLAGRLEVSPPSLTALVDGAVGRGLVERVAVEGDRRCVDHRLTDDGARALAHADRAVTAKLDVLTGHLPPGDAAAVWHGLRLLGQAIDAHHDAHHEAHHQAHHDAQGARPDAAHPAGPAMDRAAR